MSLERRVKRFLCQAILEKTGEPAVFDDEACETLLRREATDWLFIGLGAFTHIYLLLMAILFFGNFADDAPLFFFAIDALQEPYLGALGVYVILKEIRKRGRPYPSRYWGELFVVFWAAFSVIATVLTFISPHYQFDAVYKIILTNGLVVLLIYMGSLINKP